MVTSKKLWSLQKNILGSTEMVENAKVVIFSLNKMLDDLAMSFVKRFQTLTTETKNCYHTYRVFKLGGI